MNGFLGLNNAPEANKFKVAWLCVFRKAKSWKTLTFNPGPVTIYSQLKEVVLFAAPSKDVKWVMEGKL